MEMGGDGLEVIFVKVLENKRFPYTEKI